MSNWNLENQILEIMIRNENNETEALSSFYFDWIYECGQSFMQLKQKEVKLQVVSQISVYFIVAQNAIVDNWIHWLTLGYLILMDIYKESDKDKVLL